MLACALLSRIHCGLSLNITSVFTLKVALVLRQVNGLLWSHSRSGAILKKCLARNQHYTLREPGLDQCLAPLRNLRFYICHSVNVLSSGPLLPEKRTDISA